MKEKRKINDVVRDCLKRLKEDNSSLMVELNNYPKEISKEEAKSIVTNFLDENIYDLLDNGEYALMMCEEENNYHMVTYWISGTYSDVNEFLKENYSSTVAEYILNMYPYDLDNLKRKILKKYGECTDLQIVFEALASILLSEYQNYPVWYSVYGCEEEDLIDFEKYDLNNALQHKENFPVMKMEDVTAAMLGINNSIQPSNLYDIFAHKADQLKLKKQKQDNFFCEADEEPIFTPDVFQIAAVVSRWKNYVDYIGPTLKKGKTLTDYVVKFFKISNIGIPGIKAAIILEDVLHDYFTRFSSAPVSFPLHPDMVKGYYSERENKYHIDYRIRGIQSCNNKWDKIFTGIYDVPASAFEYQKLIYQIAIDFKRELVGMEKERNSSKEAVEGKYPNKYSATIGINFIKDLNVQFKNERGIFERKTPKANFDLNLAEQQSLYLIKKMVRHSSKKATISTSFGIDSTVTQHLLRRVTKNNYWAIHNDSGVEYPELVQYRRKMIKEWNLADRLYVTKPIRTYWDVKKEYGFNLYRKGDRRVNKINGKKVSASEVCCYYVKHKPTYDLVDKLKSEGNPIMSNFTGLRAEESTARMKQIKRDNVIYYAKSWGFLKASPIAYFTEDMVWQYVKKYNIPYCEVYDKVVYYEDAFENVKEEERDKVLYYPRIGCWPCLLNTKRYYLYFLKKNYRNKYDFLMFKEGLAKELFKIGAKKLGIVADFAIVEDTNKKNTTQLSLFDYNEVKENNNAIDLTNITDEQLLERFPLEYMENLITKRPCKFMQV